MMGKKVLVVDDEEMIRKFLRIHLSKWGFEVKEAADGSQALEELGNDHFELIICDIMMPNKDGWQVLKEVKSNPKTRDVAVIFLTAKQQESDMLKAYQLGVDHYITKPFSKDELLQGVRSVCGGASEEERT
jgi:two-component system response regulator ResD